METRRGQLVALLIATLAVAVILIATQPRDVFWGSDSGNRFIQLQSILRNNSLAIEHRWPIGHHFLQVNGKTYSYYSPFFSIIAAPFPSLFVLPIAGTLLLILLLPRLTAAPILPLGLILIFGTPIFWYTIVFWEHTLAAAIAIAAFVLVERDRLLIAGLLAGLSTFLREEGYIVIASIAIALLIAKWRAGVPPAGPPASSPALFVGGSLISLIPLWTFNYKLFGHPLGLHAEVYSSIARGNKLSNFFAFLFEFSSVKPANVVLIVPAVALVFAFALPARVRIALFALTTIGFAVLTFLFLRSPAPIHETLYLQGLFPAIPFSAAMFLSIPKDRFRLVTVAAGIVLTTLMLNQADFGVIWGPRHFLWLLPLIIVLAADALGENSGSWTVVASAIVLIICSFTIQFRGIELLRSKLRFSKSVLEAVRRDPAPIVLTDVFWIPEDLGAAFYERDFGVVRNDRELAAAMQTIGRRPFLFIAARQFRLVSNAGLTPMMKRVKKRQRIAGIDPMLDVMLLGVE